MLPTFVIGLREGLEAALIVSIIAAFLNKQGRKDLLRWVFVGVGIAVTICLGIGIALKVVSQDLPQKQQEGMETVIGAIAVCMVTYMVVWMKRHSRDLKGQLEGLAAEAMDGSSRAARAMVLMAFLAVLREGIETVVFLLATFNESHLGADGPIGALLGIVVAVGLGYGIYRGGVRLNLSKFFRATGLVLVFVAAGLVVNAVHTAHEAGWLNSGQGSTVDLTWLVKPGSVQSSLLTGMLGVQPYPVVIEWIGWLVYLVPVGLYVAWPAGRGPSKAACSRLGLAVSAAAAACAVAVAIAMPAKPASNPTTTGTLAGQPGSIAAHVVAATPRQVTLAVSSPGGASAERLVLARGGPTVRGGVHVVSYGATTQGAAPVGYPARLSLTAIAALNGGRLPLGVRPAAGVAVSDLPVSYAARAVTTALIEPRTGRIVDLTLARIVTVSVRNTQVGTVPLSVPYRQTQSRLAAGAVVASAAAARRGVATLERRSEEAAAIGWSVVVMIIGLLVALGATLGLRRRQPIPAVAVSRADPLPVGR